MFTKRKMRIINISFAVLAIFFIACDGDSELYTITFDVNGATSGTPPAVQEVSAGSSITLCGIGSLEKIGCIFGGWNTETSGAGTNYHANSSYTVTADITLYAKWTLIEIVTSDDGMTLIPAGTFIMGSSSIEPSHLSSETQHEVTLTESFYISQYPVTQAQYYAVIGSNPSYLTSSDGDDPDNRPVENVSWYDALVFCNKLSIREGLSPAYRINGSTDTTVWGTVPTSVDTAWNAVQIVDGSTGYRLPTEAQWEYACRAGTTTAFNWGTDYIDDNRANYQANYLDSNNTVLGVSLERTSEVGSYAPNAWGLYDMHGNVWEWCWDWFEGYSSGARFDPSGASSGTDRIIRGGCWSYTSHHLRSANRGISYPVKRDSSLGFRILRPSGL
ncbi:MAG: SUMF1/EgtB/PvdO family nonheme iron enzyme [Treponema sp.]|nr:SUMF1/EgtB/PvdO family nonheme iron enzyme [Treponema sp.]